MPYKVLVVLLVVTSHYSSVESTDVGNIATIERYNGEQYGPYIVKDFHSHDLDLPSAHRLTADEEGSGDYGHPLDDDTEEGDDTGSGPIGELTNDPRPQQETGETAVEPKTLSSLEAVSEWVFLNESITAQPVPTASLTTASPPEPSTPVPPSSSSPGPAVTSSVAPECHERCVSLLEAVTLEVLPTDATFVREGEAMRMLCSVNVVEHLREDLLEKIQLNWLFQPETPPSRECSLDGQEYLAACEGFASVWEEQQRNRTHLQADILLANLAVANTGRYMCQVTGHCCGSLPQRQLQHSVTVWHADYTTELLLMSLASMILLAVVGVFYVIMKKRNEQRNGHYREVMVESAEEPITSGKVLHLPLQQDNDDFDDRDSFTSTDSADEA